MASTGNKLVLNEKKGMSLEEYEEIIGSLLSRKEVRGVAVTTPRGGAILYNKGIAEEMLKVYIEALSRIEYMCTVLAQENDVNSRWEYARIETDDYEMIITIEPDHWVFTYTDSPDTYAEEVPIEEVKDIELIAPAAVVEPVKPTEVEQDEHKSQ